MRTRLALPRLRSLSRRFPIVSIVGPRQIGKSTVARLAFPKFAFLDLERRADFERLARDPEFALAGVDRLVVDEAQRLPELFPALRVSVDGRPRQRIVLLGSASPSLSRRISESLTGRTAWFEMPAISVLEEDLDPLWVRGGFPRLHWARPRPTPEDWFESYLRTTLSQDIPDLGFRLSPNRLRSLLTMVAHAQGSVTNLSELGGALGITYHSVAHLLDVLEGVFLIRRLPPFAANIRKRLVRSPKLYVRDTGILHALLGIPFRRSAVRAHPKAGASFETFVIEQILSHARLADPSAEGFFYRTHSGVEVDLLLKLRGRLIPIEVKLGITPRGLDSIDSCLRDLSLPSAYFVNLVEKPVQLRRTIRMCNLRTLLAELDLIPK